MANILCNSVLNAGFDDALSARYSRAASSAPGSFSGVSLLIALIAVENSLSVMASSFFTIAVDIGLIAGITASVMANKVLHCAGVSGFSAGRGGNGVAFGDTCCAGRDMTRR